jgi:hypothetical protein
MHADEGPMAALSFPTLVVTMAMLLKCGARAREEGEENEV